MGHLHMPCHGGQEVRNYFKLLFEKGGCQNQCELEPSTKKKRTLVKKNQEAKNEATNAKLFKNVVGCNGDHLNETNAF